MDNFVSENKLNFMDVMCGIETILNTGEHTAKAAAPLLIDMICGRYGGDPVELARDIADMVAIVNNALGNLAPIATNAFDEMIEEATEMLDNIIDGLHPTR